MTKKEHLTTEQALEAAIEKQLTGTTRQELNEPESSRLKDLGSPGP
ncbi:hypothetical protein GCM10023187_45960 [Nibrella viscosa]|uniref:Uncharacterized protein n=1 Tax=Nibrella viscosa TaxID=1084524 RepID=A0ABP8KSM6_9BACT